MAFNFVQKDEPRILIVRPDRIGDVVLTTPLPREIKRRKSDSYIAVLVRPYTRDVFINNPFVDEIIDYEPNSENEEYEYSFWDMVKVIRSKNFTHAFMLLPTEKINWLLFYSGIKYRIGVGHKFYQFISNTKSVYRRKYNPLKHEADYCMDLARKLGIEPKTMDTEIYLTVEEKVKKSGIKNKICPNEEILIGINSTSGKSAPNLKSSEYRKLIDKLLQLKNIKVAVTDMNVPKELKNIPNVWYPNVNSALRDSIINFAALDLLISSSTGPMHIAAALKVNTLSLFCRVKACSPELWGPLGNESKILLPTEEYDKKFCEPDPKKCDYSGPGGIDSNLIFKETLNFMNLS